MQKIITAIFILAIASGCKREGAVEPIPAAGGTTAIKFSILTPTSLYPKISYSPNGAVEEYLSLSTNNIKVKFEAPTVAPTDIYLEYKTNPAGLTKLNADALAKDPAYKSFAILPDSTFKILVTKDTIKKGMQYAEKTDNNIVVYTQKIDPSINYILPITATNSAYPSAVGTGTIYYFIIGNPIAGAYKWDLFRWNLASLQTAIPTIPRSSGFDNDPTAFIPSDATTVSVPSGYFIQPKYVITFKNIGGVLSNFKVEFDATDLAALNTAGVTVVDGINILLADPIAKHYRFQYQVYNGTAFRYIIDDYEK